MIEIVLHKLLFLIYIFLQQPDNLHIDIFAARHIYLASLTKYRQFQYDHSFYDVQKIRLF